MSMYLVLTPLAIQRQQLNRAPVRLWWGWIVVLVLGAGKSGLDTDWCHVQGSAVATASPDGMRVVE